MLTDKRRSAVAVTVAVAAEVGEGQKLRMNGAQVLLYLMLSRMLFDRDGGSERRNVECW